MPNKRTVREVLPEITWDKIAPPYPDYPYFQGRETYPFRPHADGFDLVNAWWLHRSRLPWLTPSQDFAREKFHQAGLPEIAFFSGNSTQCYVANNDDFLILVFRGTEIRRRPDKSDFANIIADLEADADIALVESDARRESAPGLQSGLGRGLGEKGCSITSGVKRMLAALSGLPATAWALPWRPWRPNDMARSAASTPMVHPGSGIETSRTDSRSPPIDL